jgi:peptidoglycan biosynthesis protein MviN/MurJ (putative lipid II flippase)
LNVLVAWNLKLKASQSVDIAIARGMAWVSLFVVIGKLSGAFKEMAIAWRYGISAEVDGYLFVANLVSWPVALWFSVLTVVLVPLAARLARENPTQLPLFRAELLGAAIAIGVALALVMAVLLPFVIRAPWTGLPAHTAAFAADTVFGMAPLLPISMVASVFSIWMLAVGMHANTLLEGVPALVLAGAVLIGDSGVGPLVWGTAAGAVLHLACLALPLAKRGEIKWPRFGFSSPAWQWFRQGFAIMLIGNALMSLVTIVDLMFSVHLGTGAVSALSYANRVLALILGLGGTAISRATLPVFSSVNYADDGATGSGKAIHQAATRWIVIMFVMGAGAMLAVWWLAPTIVSLLFERGAFSADNTAEVAEAMRYGAVQFPFYFAALVLVSSLVSRGLHQAVAIGAGLNLVVKCLANYLMVPKFGINGLMLATSVMCAGSFATLYLCAWLANQRQGISA